MFYIEDFKKILANLKCESNHIEMITNSQLEEDAFSGFSMKYTDDSGTECSLYYVIDGNRISYPYLWSIDFKLGDDIVSEWILQGYNDNTYPDIQVEGGPDEFIFNGFLVSSKDFTFLESEDRKMD